MTGTSTVPKKI